RHPPRVHGTAGATAGGPVTPTEEASQRIQDEISNNAHMPTLASSSRPSEARTNSPKREQFRITRLVGHLLAVSCPPILYFAYVGHFGVNSMWWDEWTLVPMVHSALHGHLTFGALWAQYNEERLFVPKLMWVFFAIATNLNTKVIVLFDAALLTGAYICLLVAHRIARGRWIGPLPTLVVGLIWFSVADFENALWAFQIGWYLIVFLLMIMLVLFSRPRMTLVVVLCSMAIAVAGSFSGLQGLFLWPIGLLCILWRDDSTRTKLRYGLLWLIAGGITTGAYLWNFKFQANAIGGGSISYGLHHPPAVVKYFLAAIGNVFPTSEASTIGVHELVGGAICITALWVLAASVHSRISGPRDSHLPLAAALVIFALLFDLSIAVGRVSIGMIGALSSRYTMASLILLVAISTYLLDLFEARCPRPQAEPICDSAQRLRGEHERSRWHPARTRGAIALGALVLLAVVVVQVVISTRFGISNARGEQESRVLAARVAVNFDSIPISERRTIVTRNVYPIYSLFPEDLRLAQIDHLAEFAATPRRYYKRLGPPRVQSSATKEGVGRPKAR
ncbi:MAG: hypothetical protein ACRD6W_13605, partial [Nitrososphaerales archaeon]